MRCRPSHPLNPTPPLPRAFVVYAAVITAAAVAALVGLGWTWTWRMDSPALLVMLSLFVFAGELLPIPVPRRHGLAKVTISTAFAFAILLRFGVWPATVVYVTSSVLADSIDRVAPIKGMFNAAQYALAMIAAAGVLALAGTQPLTEITGADLLIVIAAAVAFFAVNHALACTAAALLAGLPILRYMRDDLPFQLWTVGCALAFAPLVLAAADSSLALVPLCFVPMLALYIGGRQAAVNSHLAFHDPLTDLPNRLLLAERLGAALAGARQEDRPLAVMILDLDDFKAINDTLGHDFGDLVLKQIATRFDEAVGDGATLARLGGDEFAVVIDGNRGQAGQAAERLLSALEEPLQIESIAVQTAASIGIACFPEHGTTALELMRHADVALYCAKASDASVQSYAEEYDQYSIDRLELAAQLRRGIERGELSVLYQPKVALHGRAVPAVEALARWNHPQLGCIGPDAFIPLAEQTGIIKLLTERVLDAALAQCGIWRRDGLDVYVSVNVSTRTLLDHDLPPMIRTLLDRHELPPSVLELEIPERRIIADLRRARSALDELRATGVKIAIDDFGTGSSTLAQLQELPVDGIKIDRSFVMRMETHDDDAVLVRSMIELGQILHLRVTAEGVENEDVSRSLRELGCDYAQGLHVARPLTAEECRDYFDGPNAEGAQAAASGSGLVPDPGAGTKASRPVPDRETRTQNRPDDVPGHGTDAKDQSLMARPGLEPGHAAADAPSPVPRVPGAPPTGLYAHIWSRSRYHAGTTAALRRLDVLTPDRRSTARPSRRRFSPPISPTA
jgi:diguanylate cyclase (GGDEF)-like protein